MRHTRVKEHPEDASIRETLRAFFSKVGGFFRGLYVLRAVKIICLILALTLTAGLLQEFILCHADHNRQRLKGFYLEDKDSLDVVFMGASTSSLVAYIPIVLGTAAIGSVIVQLLYLPLRKVLNR